MIKFSQITYRYLKADKKRAILNVLGIILSIALITSIGTMAVSYNYNNIRSIRKEHGNYHTKIFSLEKSKVKDLEASVGVEKIGINRTLGYYRIKENEYLSIRELSPNSFNMLSLNLISGRLPKNKNEAVIQLSSVNRISGYKKIGDIIKLPYGSLNVDKENIDIDKLDSKYTRVGDLEIKIVGILKDFSVGFFERGTVLICREDFLKYDKTDVYLKFKENRSLVENIKNVKAQLGEKYIFEDNLLLVSNLTNNFHNDIEKTANRLASILIIVIIICTVLVIYNSFNISVLERIKQFGILRSVGASPKHIKKMFIKESIILGLIGIPLGIISGFIAVKVVLTLIGQNQYSFFYNFKIIISSTVILISILIGVFSIFISCMFPAIYASKVSPLMAVQNRGSIKSKKEKIKTNRIIRAIFKIEGDLAYKNLRRNKKKFRITSFSIAVSVILFVVFHGFLSNVLKIDDVYSKFNEQSKIILSLQGKDFLNPKSKDYKFYENFKKNPHIKIDKKYSNEYFYGNIPANKVLDESLLRGTNNTERDMEHLNLEVYDEGQFKNFNKYLESGNCDYKKMAKNNEILIMQNTYVKNSINKKHSIEKLYDFKVGDIIELESYIEGKNEKNIKYKFRISGILNKKPYGDAYFENDKKLVLIGTKALKEKIIKEKINFINKSNKNNKKDEKIQRKTKECLKDDLNCNCLSISLKSKLNSNEIYNLVRDIEKSAVDNGIGFYESYKYVETRNQFRIAIRVFIYGFISVICAISILNIINSISTNIILRKREFAITKAIGLSNKGIKKMIILEGILYSLIGVLYGSIIGTIIVNILNKTIQNSFKISLSLPYKSILIVTIFSLIIGYLSTLIPLRKIKQINIIDEIKRDL